MAYSIESLEGGIEKCKKNIEIFEEAIEKERDTIREYRSMIDVLEEKESRREEIQKHISIEIDRDGD